ncbi:MAG TPA: hypothetical protein VGG74_24120 [Kofleriaceae bacterium]|jgi:hypothetical protein
MGGELLAGRAIVVVGAAGELCEPHRFDEAAIAKGKNAKLAERATSLISNFA